MRTAIIKHFGAFVLGAILALAPQAHAQSAKSPAETSGHHHGSSDFGKGIFQDNEIKARTLADWQGDWQSVYPYLQDGTLDPVMEHKAEQGEKTAEEYRAHYEKGYRTDVDRISVSGDSVTFHKNGKSAQGTYIGDDFEILTYEAGNRGVRYVFRKTAGDADAPQFIQFSDHRIAPHSADHYHLYWGNDRAALLREMTNWPTYYPAALDGQAIVREMTAH